MHGAGNRGNPGGRPPIHGRYSKAFRNLSKLGAERYAELIADPELLDTRRPVAMSHLLLERIPLDEETVELIAQSYVKGDGNPTDAHRLKARLTLAALAADFTDRFARAQNQAVRTSQIGELVLQGAAPVLKKFGERVLRLAEHYVPADRMDDYRRDLTAAGMATVAELGELEIK